MIIILHRGDERIQVNVKSPRDAEDAAEKHGCRVYEDCYEMFVRLRGEWIGVPKSQRKSNTQTGLFK